MPTLITAGDGSNGAVITSASDNALTIQTGAAGAKVNAAAFASDGTLTLLKNPVSVTAQSMVRVNTAAGNGSSNTAIRYFTNVTNGVNGAVIQGSDISLSNDSTNGAAFTINTSGVYAISYSDYASAASMGMGLSLNATGQLSTSIISVSLANALIQFWNNVAGVPQCIGTTVYLAAGSVVRPHTSISPTVGSGNGPAHFTITRVA